MTQQPIKWQFLPAILVIIFGLAACGAQTATPEAPAADLAAADTLSLPVDIDTFFKQTVGPHAQSHYPGYRQVFGDDLSGAFCSLYITDCLSGQGSVASTRVQRSRRKRPPFPHGTFRL